MKKKTICLINKGEILAALRKELKDCHKDGGESALIAIGLEGAIDIVNGAREIKVTYDIELEVV